MYYKRTEAHPAYPGLPSSPELGILTSTGEAAPEPKAERFVSADMAMMLDDIAHAEAAPTPEDPEAASGMLHDVGSVGLKGAGVSVEDPVAESLVHDDSTTEVDTSTGGPSSVEVEIDTAEEPKFEVVDTPRTMSPEEIAAIKESVAEVFPTPEAGDLPDASDTEIVTKSEATVPLTGRHLRDKETPKTVSPEDQAIIDQLVKGKLTDLGTKIQGARDLRKARKEIISRQREAMDQVVSDAKGAVWNARGKRVRAFLDNNAVKRVGMRRDKRAELRNKAFEAIDNIDDPKIGSARKRLMRLQARKNAWKIARKEVKARTDEAFATAKGNVDNLKRERGRQKDRRAQLKLRPWRRRQTLSGATVGYRASYEGARTDLVSSEEKKRREQQKRIAELQKRNAAAKAKWQNRDVSKHKSDRSRVHGPATPGKKADSVSGSF